LKWAIANEEVKIIVQTGRGKYYTTGKLCVVIGVDVGMDIAPSEFAPDPSEARFGKL
jgi:hypothetical protein